VCVLFELVQDLPELLILCVDGETGLQLDDDEAFEIAVFKGEVVLPEAIVLHDSVSMRPLDGDLLLFHLFFERRVDEL